MPKSVCNKSTRGNDKVQTRNLVIVSDTHCGDRLGLCPPSGASLDDGGKYQPSTLQLKMWAMWDEFWKVWVPHFTKNEEYAIVFNGDVVDGVHHGSTNQISHNMEDQAEIAYQVLSPVIDNKKCIAYYHVRGTEAHVGKQAVEEERLAKRLGAIQNTEGQYARWELWKSVGDGLIHCLHHIGTTGSAAYESTAVHKELVEAYVEAGRWKDRAPDIIVRSHRHRYFRTEIAAAGPGGDAIAVVTPCFQLKTPYCFRIPGARQSQPQFGGIVIRHGDEELHVRKKVWRLERPPVE